MAPKNSKLIVMIRHRLIVAEQEVERLRAENESLRVAVGAPAPLLAAALVYATKDSEWVRRLNAESAERDYGIDALQREVDELRAAFDALAAARKE